MCFQSDFLPEAVDLSFCFKGLFLWGGEALAWRGTCFGISACKEADLPVLLWGLHEVLTVTRALGAGSGVLGKAQTLPQTPLR